MKTPTILAVLLVATLVGACQKSTPPAAAGQSSVIDKASAAPSLAGTPVAPTPATHAAPAQTVPSTEPTARDNPATEPLADLTKEKEVVSMPLAGHGNNHSSDALKGKDAPKQ